MHDALLQFMSKAPIGLAQVARDGKVETINRLGAAMLAPISGGGPGTNLFAVLTGLAPALRARLDEFTAETGTVCEGVRLTLPALNGVSKILSVSIFKLDAARLVVSLAEPVSAAPAQPMDPNRTALAKELRTALSEDRLFVQYQPIVGLSKLTENDFGLVDRSRGVEALVRWNHRIRGAIRPADFIGVAEEFGLIERLGEFVLRTGCRQFMQWQNDLGAHAPRMLAVNLSRGQLTAAGLVESVKNILKTTAMQPSALQLELNEKIAVSHDSMRQRLQDLKSLGVTLALDNFGTGNSSLANLHLLPVDVIKIDRSFTSDAATSQQRRVLIQATVRVAKSLQMHAGAEGIETEGQLAVMRELGCGSAQGFLFSEAMSAPNVAQWVASETSLL